MQKGLLALVVFQTLVIQASNFLFVRIGDGEKTFREERFFEEYTRAVLCGEDKNDIAQAEGRFRALKSAEAQGKNLYRVLLKGNVLVALVSINRIDRKADRYEIRFHAWNSLFKQRYADAIFEHACSVAEEHAGAREVVRVPFCVLGMTTWGSDSSGDSC